MIQRGLAAFLGAFTLINLICGAFVPRFDANGWWIRLFPLPYGSGAVVLLLAAVVLLAFAAGAIRNRSARLIGAGVLAVVAVFALANTIEFYRLAFVGRIRPWVPVPLSFFVSAVLGWVAMSLWRGRTDQPIKPRRRLILLATVAAMLVAFPLAQMFFFGTTDYRRHADVAVVFGARTYADGAPSQALSDRVKTAIGLYDQGLVGRLFFSGGPGDGSVSEPQAMRQLAIDSGVPAEAIVLDEAGLNTDATVKNTCAAFEGLDARRVLVVSHAYHLPRVKLAYQRAGWEVGTVPARQSRRLRNEPNFIAREVVALWVYYLRPIL